VLTTDELIKPGGDDCVEKLDVAAVNSAVARALYKAREPIYPKLVHGKFRALKWAMLIATLAVYYILPWIRWARGPGEPDQAVLVDFPGRRFYFFFIEIWPDELYYLTGLLILAALGLFLATALFGRVWCGYTCPQTVWTDLFIAVERLVEGDRNKRIKLAKAPWSPEKIAKKATKHALWIVIAAVTGGAWVFYFHDAPTIFPQLFRGEAPASAYLFVGLLTFTTYMLAGSMREQVCTYMCPWPRIQAALTDAETLEVTYKYDRGEPRGSHKKNQSWEGRGDCVDCNACVAACPMGIDIRDGAQLECINCALCIDACDETMKKVGRPTGLIDYDTDGNIERRKAGLTPQIRLFRARTALYAGVIAIVGALMLFGFSTRATLEVNVLRDRTPPFVRLSDGSVRNAYTVKIINKANAARDFTISAAGSGGLVLSSVGEAAENNALTVTAEADGLRSVRVFVTAPEASLARASKEITLTVEETGGGERVRKTTAFVKDRR
jgi:cytochrome c oxidase accessory protein FixG